EGFGKRTASGSVTESQHSRNIVQYFATSQRSKLLKVTDINAHILCLLGDSCWNSEPRCCLNHVDLLKGSSPMRSLSFPASVKGEVDIAFQSASGMISCSLYTSDGVSASASKGGLS